MNINERQQFQGLMQLAGGFRAARVILTANNLQVFEHLKTPKAASQLAARINTDTRATETLLDAIAALDLIKKTGRTYQNTSVTKKFLLKESRWYQGDMLRHLDALWINWSGLDEVVETGLPNRASKRDHDSFIRAMHNNAALRAPQVIDAIDLRGVKKALDLGGGPGTYSMEIARRGIATTLFDLPNTIDISRKIVSQAKIRNVEFMRGDFNIDDIGSGYDLVLVSHILHSLSQKESMQLLKKAKAALNSKGRIAIQEFILDNDRTSPVQSALFSVNMLVNTSAGRCYSCEEMKAWLSRTGFKEIKSKVLGDTVMVTGRKA